ncbi:hypothetical protein BHE74_00015887 [Ensete ventricosum]|nr:hypothetical protein BHE74_00015887 [Ensete ventricosum]RZR99296.1 hypothetical protein BHM03_00028814 [Ensete ventricosum]
MEKRPKRKRDLEITFKSGGEEYTDHDNAMVILARIANARVKSIMVDTWSSTDILYFDAFKKLGLTDRDLVSMTFTLAGFTGDSISPLGITILPVSV